MEQKYFYGKFYCLTRRPDNSKFYTLNEIAEFGNYPFKQYKRLITFVDDRIDDIEYIWDGFNDYFTRIGSVLKIKEIYCAYYKKALAYQVANRNDYMEIRAGASNFITNNDDEVFSTAHKQEQKAISGTEIPDSIQALYNAYNEVRKDYTDLTIKVIISLSRRQSDNPEADTQKAVEALGYVPAWQQLLKDGDHEFIVGYDLVREGYINHTTYDYAEAII